MNSCVKEIPDKMKLMVFGINGKVRMRFAGKPPERTGYTVPEGKELAEYKRIERILEKWGIDDRNVMRDFSLGILANETGINKRNLERYFAEYTDIGFREWKNWLRIEKGKELILSPETMTIEEISDNLGFQDKCSFYRLFRKQTGYTPGEWRSTGGHPEMGD